MSDKLIHSTDIRPPKPSMNEKYLRPAGDQKQLNPSDLCLERADLLALVCEV